MAEEKRRCLSCGYAGGMKTWLSNYATGWLTSIILLCLWIIPGLIFIMWGWKKFKCPQCGALAKNVPFTAATPLQGAKTKKCPLCAEEIKPEAVKCRYCGSDIPASAENASVGPASPISGAPVKKPTSKLVKIGGTIILLFLFSGFIGALLSPHTSTTPSTPPSGGDPKTSTTFPGAIYKVVWKQGLILGLLVPANTTPWQEHT